MLVDHNTSKQKSTLKKKYNAIAYHAICKSAAMEKSLTRNMKSEDNPTDLLTKVGTILIRLAFYDIYNVVF